jgi:hypothetical protein
MRVKIRIDFFLKPGWFRAGGACVRLRLTLRLELLLQSALQYILCEDGGDLLPKVNIAVIVINVSTNTLYIRAMV